MEMNFKRYFFKNLVRLSQKLLLYCRDLLLNEKYFLGNQLQKMARLNVFILAHSLHQIHLCEIIIMFLTETFMYDRLTVQTAKPQIRLPINIFNSPEPKAPGSL